MKALRAKRTRDGSLSLTFDYDERFIELLKKRVPHTARSYDPETRTWTIHQPDDGFMDWLRENCPAVFDSAIYEYRDDGDLVEVDLLNGTELTRTEALFK